jgi:tripartite-type tricarboxylate transporter receptor subunit TctC
MTAPFVSRTASDSVGRMTVHRTTLHRTLASAVFIIVCLAGSLSLGNSWAQTYPARPITLVVPFPAGGATDAIARILVDSMSQKLGQTIVVEDIGGAGGMIGAARAARAAPDGYTLLLHQVAIAAGMSLYQKLSFDAEKDLAPIGIVNVSSSTIGARSTLPPNNLAELVAWMKQPGQITKIAHAGVGSFGHLCGVLFAQEIGAQAAQIPYRGGGPALNDLIAGQVDLSCLSAAIIAPLAKNGSLKAYGIIGRNRFAGLPDQPTMAEAGYKNLAIDFWHILFTPAGTPAPVVATLNTALRHALADKKVIDAFAASGMEVYPEDRRSPEVAAELLKSEIKRWGDVVRTNNISLQ